MTKYTEQFKLSVVQQYLDGVAGYKVVAAQHGLDDSMVRRWVGCYRIHGASGLAKKYSHYSSPFKLSVLQHMWDNALSYTQAAALFNIRNPSGIQDWENSYRHGGLDALTPRVRGRPRKMAAPTTKPVLPSDDDKRTREELLAEVNHLRMENAYLKKLRALVQAQQKAAPPKKRK